MFSPLTLPLLVLSQTLPVAPTPPPPPAAASPRPAAPSRIPADASATIPADASATIVVTALPPRAGDPVYGGQRIDADRIQGAASGRIESALTILAGVQQFRRSDGRSANASAQGLTLRSLGGNAASRTLLLLDGVPQGDAFFGTIAFAAIAPDTLAGATVVRGSGVGPFGSGALAGVISLESRALAGRPAVDLSLAAGSKDALQASLGIAAPLGAGHVALDMGSDRGDGFFTTPPDQRNAGTVRARYAAERAALSVAIPLAAGTSLSARIAGFSDRRTLRLAGADSRSDGIDMSVRLIARGDGQAAWGIEALGWLQMRDFANVVVSNTTLRPTLDQRATPSTGWGVKLALTPPSPVAGTGLRFGVDARGATGRVIEDVLTASGARTLTRTTGGRTAQFGLFAEWDAAVGPLLVTLGARGDRVQQSGGFLIEARGDGSVQADRRFAVRTDWLGSVRGGVAWDVLPALTLRAAGYGGHRVPTLNELYRPFILFPVTTRANPALTPERLWGAELGARYGPAAGVMVDLTLFDNRLSDAIGNVTLTPTLRERRNLGTIVARGIELRGDAALGAGWRVGAGVAATRARVRAGDAAAVLDGLRPAQSPALTASAELARDWRGGARTTLVVRHIGAAFEDDLNRDILPAVQTVDAVIDVPVGRGWRVIARAENLAGARVVTRNAGGTLDLGTPRLLWLGLRWTP